MISPLPGPSTIIHIFIIFVGGTISFTKKTYKDLERWTNEINRAKILSTMIILLILMFVLWCSYYAIASGFMGDNSNMNIVEKLFSSSFTGVWLDSIMNN